MSEHDPYIHRLPDGMKYAEVPDYVTQKVQRHLAHSCDEACMRELFIDDKILNAEFVLEDILDAEEIG